MWQPRHDLQSPRSAAAPACTMLCMLSQCCALPLCSLMRPRRRIGTTTAIPPRPTLGMAVLTSCTSPTCSRETTAGRGTAWAARCPSQVRAPSAWFGLGQLATSLQHAGKRAFAAWHHLGLVTRPRSCCSHSASLTAFRHHPLAAVGPPRGQSKSMGVHIPTTH